jgi:hypothetical protein
MAQDPTDAMVRFLVVFTAAVGIGLLAWLLIVIASMATAAAAAAGAGGISLTVKLGKGK